MARTGSFRKRFVAQGFVHCSLLNTIEFVHNHLQSSIIAAHRGQ